MCGIVGIWTQDLAKKPHLDQMLACMNTALLQRGPNGHGQWSDHAQGIGFGHRRLAILDLSSSGQQPMQSHCGRYVITFNGEIYNHLSLRKSLQHTVDNWRGHSDTEILLQAIAVWGLEAALQAAIGMFAFALWDKHTSSLVLARDRIGEKPLYYGFWGQSLLFASDLKAFQALPDFHPEIDQQALTSFLRLSYVPAPLSIYKNFYKLPAASYLKITAASLQQQTSAPQFYWDLADVRSAPKIKYNNIAEVTTQLENLLKTVIREQCSADVPVGCFLSGGLDSSLVAAIMQANNTAAVRTFSMGFSSSNYDEAPYAKAIAQHLGTKHTEVYVSPEQALAVVEDLAQIYAEPFADSSQIPSYLIAKIAARDVTVCLSGDGGDELFGGYNRYKWAQHLWQFQSCIPYALRKVISQYMTGIAPQKWNSLQATLMQSLGRKPVAQFGDKMHKIAASLQCKTKADLYLGLTSVCRDPLRLLLAGSEPNYLMADQKSWPQQCSFTEQMMFVDCLSYLPDDILAKVDRAGMAASLETRIPLLDQRIVEFAWALEPKYRLHACGSKFLLRSLLQQYVPERLFKRPKMGFAIPLDEWLRGPLREFAAERLSTAALASSGVFDPKAIAKMWAEHQSGARNWQHVLWNVLMYQNWNVNRHCDRAINTARFVNK